MGANTLGAVVGARVWRTPLALPPGGPWGRSGWAGKLALQSNTPGSTRTRAFGFTNEKG